MSTAKPPLPVALTISGAVALGAYEGGVLAALLHGLEPLYAGAEPRVRIDAIGGASAGSITGLLAARCITEGIDACDVMYSAWVEHATFDEMRAHDLAAPLTAAPLERLAADLLAMPGKPSSRQQSPVQISMALGALRGLDYRIAGLFSTSELHATTFLDWKDATVTPGQPLSDFVHVEPRPGPGHGEPTLVDFAVASGANPLGFGPRAVSRHADAATYRRHVDNFPETETYWYTDGGTLDNEPLGRTLDLVDDLDRDGSSPRRLVLLVHPHPTAAPSGGAWAEPGRPPTWVETLVRAHRLQTTQSIYDDLRHADKTNRRIAAIDELAHVLADALRDLAEREMLDARLAVFLTAADEGRAARGAPPLPPRPEGAGTDVLLGDALRSAAGLGGKRTIGIEVLSPLLLPEVRGAPGVPGVPVEDLLAGEFLLHFGGFARPALRKQDFDLGYRTVTEWFQRHRPLAHHGLDPSADDEAFRAADKRYKPGRPDPKLGKTGFKTLRRSERWALERIFARAARIALRDWRHPTRQGRPIP